MIDLHFHLLPGVDDGPHSRAQALELAAAAVAAGTRAVVATPHIDHHHGLDPAAVGPAVAGLRSDLGEAGIALDVHAGGEVALSRLGDLAPDELEALTFGPGRWVLLEAPLGAGVVGLDRQVFELQLRGHAVLLAHPERCPALHRRPEQLEALVAAGVLCQVTAGSLLGQFGSTVRKVTERFVRDGLVHVVASDAHDVGRRPPDLREGAEAAAHAAGSPEAAEWFVEAVPRAILAGTAVPPRPEGQARRWWRR